MSGQQVFGIAALLCMFVVTGCGDDELKNVTSISTKSLVLSKDRTLGADLTYSDSAVVKAKGFAPVLDRVTQTNGQLYQEMPKGVKIDFYEQGRMKGSISSEYAIRKDGEKTTLFRENVVVRYPDGEYRCEELTWDENTKRYLSPAGTLTKTDGTVLQATDFDASQDFRSIKMNQTTATTYTKGDL